MQTGGILFDGEVAADRPVTIALEHGGVRFSGPGTSEQFWSLTKLRAIEPPQAGRPLRLTAEGHDGARLVIGDENFKSALAQAAPHISGGFNARRMVYQARWFVTGGASLAVVLYLVLQLGPQTLARLLPDTWRDRVGQQIEASLTGGARQCTAAGGVAALSALAARLAEGNPGLLAMSINIYDMKVMNAFAMPGNRIVITGELIAKASSPDEVAGVLAHEMGHVVLRHSEAQLVRATGLEVLISLFAGGGGDTIGSIAGVATILQYSRGAEAEADAFALSTLAAAEVDPLGLKHFFELVLKEEGKSSGGTLGKIGSLIATHPGTEGRIKNIAPLPPGITPRPALSAEQWQALKRICESQTAIPAFRPS